MSRRGFLTGVAAARAAAAIPTASWAQVPARTLIDNHHHYYPPAYLNAMVEFEKARHMPHFPAHMSWTREKAVEEMDRNGIRTALLSIASTPGVWSTCRRRRLAASCAAARNTPPR